MTSVQLSPRDPRDLMAEMIRRDSSSNWSYVIRVSDPITIRERLQLMAAQLQRVPVMIVPRKCKTVDEYVAHYASRNQ